MSKLGSLSDRFYIDAWQKRAANSMANKTPSLPAFANTFTFAVMKPPQFNNIEKVAYIFLDFIYGHHRSGLSEPNGLDKLLRR